jgi:hypothetical protein
MEPHEKSSYIMLVKQLTILSDICAVGKCGLWILSENPSASDARFTSESLVPQ